MPIAAWVTIVLIGLIIAAAALGLAPGDRPSRSPCTARSLRCSAACRSIADKTRPVPAALESVNANLKPVRDFCESI